MLRRITEADTGLKVLCTPQPNTPPSQIIECVIAIHGIGAHPDDTWSKKVASAQNVAYVNWLEHAGMLPAAVPNARILRYGYGSPSLENKTRETVRLGPSEIAIQLLWELKIDRKDYPDRPLIFLSHCFGGFVLLKALRLAFDDRTNWAGIYHSTAGMLFFGTPFRGTGAMKQSDMLASALSYYQPDQVQKDSLRTLVPGDEFLQDTIDRFLQARKEPHPAPVACFYETKPSNIGALTKSQPKWEFIVNKSSGCLDQSDSIVKVPLARTHFDIHQFGASTEPSFRAVREIVIDMVDGATDLLRKRSQGDAMRGRHSPSTLRNTGSSAQNIHLGSGSQNNNNGAGPQFNGGSYVLHGFGHNSRVR